MDIKGFSHFCPPTFYISSLYTFMKQIYHGHSECFLEAGVTEEILFQNVFIPLLTYNVCTFITNF